MTERCFKVLTSPYRSVVDVLLRYNATSVVDMDAIQVTKGSFSREQLPHPHRQPLYPTLDEPQELTVLLILAGTTFPLS